MPTWFKTQSLDSKITPVEVVKETDCFITLEGERYKRSKRSDWDNYYPEWILAHSALMDKASDRVVTCRRQLELANAALGNIKGMKPPTP